MTIYVITFLLFLLLGYFDLYVDLGRYKKNILYGTLFLLLVFQVGFRWETGTDWIPYKDNFDDTTSIEMVFLGILNGFEIGYGYCVYLVRSRTDDYSFFLIIHAIVFFALVFKANRKLSPFPIVSLLIFYTLTIGVMGSNRQLIALAICLYSLQFVDAKKPIIFFILVVLASLFHTTAVIFTVFYFLNRDFKKYQILLAILLAFIIGKTSLPNLFFSGFGNLLGGTAASKAEVYGEIEVTAGLSLFGLIRRLIYFAIFLYNYDKLSQKFRMYKLLFNGFLFGLIFYFLFSSTLIILVNRGSLYFNVMESFLLASQLLLFTPKDRGYVFVMLIMYSIYIFFQSISAYEDLFIPYKGIFINSNFSRYLY